MSGFVETVREALAKTDLGPMAIRLGRHRTLVEVVGVMDVRLGTLDDAGADEAALIAAAPGWLAELCDRLSAAEAQISDMQPAACDMKCQEPYDFAWCETHDTTFPLGYKCKFDGREAWEVFAAEADEQRGMTGLPDSEYARKVAEGDES